MAYFKGLADGKDITFMDIAEIDNEELNQLL
jgi:hypothetical protein